MKLLNFRTRLIGASVALLVLVATFFAWQVRSAALEREAAQRVQLQTYARAVGAEIQNAVRSIDLGLKGVSAAVASLPDGETISEPSFRRILLARPATEDDDIFFVASDDTGTAITSSNGVPVRGTSFADRDFYLAHRDGRETGLYVAEPVIGKVTKREVIVLSRRLQTASGDFAGVVWAPVDVRIITRLLQKAMFQEGLSITLVHAPSAKVVARVPPVDNSFLQNVRSAPLFEHLKAAPNGTFEFMSVVDGQRRIYAYDQLLGMPLVVTVGISTDSLSAARNRDIVMAAVLWLLVAATLALSDTLVLRQYAAARAREVSVKARNAELQALLQAVPAPILVAHDKLCRHVTGNPAALRALGVPVDTKSVRLSGAWLGATDSWDIGEGDPWSLRQMPLQVAIRTGAATALGEYKIQLPDGTMRYVYGGAVPLRDDQGEVMGAVASFIDTTDRRENETLRAEKEAAELASRSKSEFLSRMSHELRTPLNAILGFSQLLELDQADPLTRDQLVRVGHVRSAGEHLLRLIGDLLDISGLETGNLKVRSERVCLAPEVRAVVQMMDGQAKAAGIEIRDEASRVKPSYVNADATRIKQVVLNLMSNGIKYGRNGGVLTLHTTLSNENVRLTVSDNGIGMSEQQVGQLFQPFNRLGREFTAIRGTGIGLVITKQLVEAMGGSLSVVSAPDVGSSFMVDLPAAPRLLQRSTEPDGETPRDVEPVE